MFPIDDCKVMGWIQQEADTTVITLHPRIAALVKAEAERCKLWDKSAAPDGIVNEILWLALRGGDTEKHFLNHS